MMSTMVLDADRTTSLWNEKFYALIPLLGAGIALTYDVGYFWAIGISFFTLFSLSEHIVFALQAFPLALVLLPAFIALTMIMGKESKPALVEPEKVSRRQRIAAFAAVIVIFLIAFSVLAYELYVLPAGLLIAIDFGLGGWGYYTISSTNRGAFIASIAILVALTISFILGNLWGASVLATQNVNAGDG
jgi:hypothetical protein